MSIFSGALLACLVTSLSLLPILSVALVSASTTIPITPGASSGGGVANALLASAFTTGSAGTVTDLGIKLSSSLSAGNKLVLGIYQDSSNYPGTLLGQTNEITSGSAGWVTAPLQASVAVSSNTKYWLAHSANVGGEVNYDAGGTSVYYSLSYSATLPSNFKAGGLSQSYTYALEYVLSTGPPPSDFTLTASPTSASIVAGGTASSTLTVTAGGGFSGAVSLSVTSGCPAGVTCTVNPTSVATSGTSMLSVPTLVTTTGTFPVVVTATSGALSHTATFTVTVTTSPTYNFNVHTGATQVVVTVSWSGSGTASVTIAGPGGTPTLSESGAVVYDRTTYQSGSSTPTNIHRVTFTLSSPPTGTWTAYVSQSGATVTIEVS
jgi:hypothetical protein